MRTKHFFLLAALGLSLCASAQVDSEITPQTASDPPQAVLPSATTGVTSGESSGETDDQTVEGTLKQYEKLKRKIDAVKKELEASEKESIGF